MQALVAGDTHDRPLVLIADRELLYRWFASECLEDAGRRAASFATIPEMLSYLARIDEPVVVLVDGPMLVNAGLALATALEQTPSIARVYILTDTPEDPRWREHGGDVVAKPSDRDQLLKLVA
jgi:CheY-like chemotaxis protein